MTRTLALLAFSLVGCHAVDAVTCATYAELEVTNPDGLAPAEYVAEVEAAIDEFAALTGREGVCVAEARLVPEIVLEDGDTAAGMNHDGWIEIAYTAGNGVQGLVFHELCHAVDREMGWWSETRPDWFGDEPHEVFAEACDEGPRPVSLVEARESACGADFGADRQRWFNEEVYAAAVVASEPPEGLAAVTVERRAVTSLPEEWDWDVVAGGATVYLAGRTAWVEGEPQYVLVYVVDPVSTAVIDTIVGPEVEPRMPELLASDGEPLLVRDGEASAAWRLDTAGRSLVEVPFPALDDLYAGAVLGDEAWIVGTLAGDDTRRFWRVDLSTGEPAEVELPADVSSWRPVPDRGLLAGGAWPEEGSRFWLAYEPATGEWTRAASPAGFAAADWVPLADGRLLSTWSDRVAMSTYDPTGLAVLDPASGDWWLADQPCDADTIGMTTQILSIDGEPWLWEFPNGWKEGDPFVGQHTLTRVVVEPSR